MSERFKELVLKTSDPKRAVGSNPTLSASIVSIEVISIHHGEVLKLVKRRPC